MTSTRKPTFATATARAASRHAESILQRNCVTWFRLQYRAHAPLLFAVPNGGGRSRVEAAIMKAEGVTPGVADLILLTPRGGYGSLCIEMKTTAKGSGQSRAQREWQLLAEAHGNRYAVVRSFEEFQAVVNDYMSRKPSFIHQPSKPAEK
jgi:hypothetical protein